MYVERNADKERIRFDLRYSLKSGSFFVICDQVDRCQPLEDVRMILRIFFSYTVNDVGLNSEHLCINLNNKTRFTIFGRFENDATCLMKHQLPNSILVVHVCEPSSFDT